MAPIPLHTNSPINPAKASGITPQTASPDNNPLSSDQQPTPTKTTSIPPQNGPPSPQPGATPHLPAVTPFPTSSGGPLPPQPAAASAITPAPSYPPPPQTSVPAPERPYNQRGTSTAFTPRTATGAAVLPGPSPYETGYQQRTGYQPSGGQVETEGEGTVLGSVMGYAKAAGERLSEAEREVWRRINGEK
ncbi:hypothetical protein QBC36DRAFT_321777 [Triangularia setosa]|uniref:Uncharacterized protein n=1 Tax=Triangularia setosa TaxID=2587417 RepID=A0AAN6WGP0_9PEZI|nr:hypothetical protein QBC36DRAFT_321777 [Podospora setosa]